MSAEEHRLRIRHLLPASPVKNTGIWDSVVMLAQSQAALGNDVLVLAPSSARKLTSEPDGLFRWYGGLLDLRRALVWDSHDVLHVHGSWSLANLVGALVATAGHGILVYSAHGMLMPDALHYKRFKKAVYAGLIESRLVRASTLCHATSDEEARSLRSFGARNVVVIPNGLPRVDTRRSLSLGRDRTILFLGRLHRIKNIESLLEAASSLSTDWEVAIAGGGDPSYEDELRSFANTRMPGRVRFVGQVYGEAKWDLLGRATVLVLPSHSENFGNVVLEALAVGTPVIASTKTPWRVLKESGAGWWVDGTPAALHAALLDVVARSDDEELRLRAHSLAQQFTVEKSARNLLSAYGSALHREASNVR